ncbi:toxin-antitoxin system YwqK family antitoxin [Fluviicola sp.]|uniref:toxin-antitoxin system YwqK family antitoxin n=1 Tax=Fluviicola sp. TaxID=1917219 RepID=UPI003D265E4D
MYKFFFWISITTFIGPFSTLGQGQIGWINYLKQVPDNLVFMDTIKVMGGYVLDFKDTLNGITLQQSIEKNGAYSINYFDVKPLDRDKGFGNHIELDSLNRMRGYGYAIGRSHLGYNYSEDGRLESYSYLIEDTTTLEKEAREFRYTEDSYVIEFHPNGVIKKHYFFIDGPQKIIEYWPNGKIRIEADMRVQWQLYCGNYVEYDMNGNLLVKGTYKFIYSSIPEHKKTGVWKYYQNGKLIRKEEF